MRSRARELRAAHAEVRLSREERIRVFAWLDASCQFHPSYWGQKNLAHRASPFFRPPVAFEEAISERWPARLQALYEPGAR
jgi:hypothetical protein